VVRNVLILALAQVFGACGTIVIVTFGGIVGARIAPSATLATLPMALTVVGVALATVPATLAMRRFGRKPTFVASALLSAVAALVGAWATAHGQFALFCAVGLLIGGSQAVVMQYRFAATEYAPLDQAGRAVGMVMVATLVAAVIGPELGDRARLAGGWPEFTGSFLALAGLSSLGALTLAWLGPAELRSVAQAASERRLRVVAAQPEFIVAVLAGITSSAVMTFIMTATPISMHVHDGMTVTATRQVITAHLVAMYAPSLISGWLTRVLGLKRMMLLGVATIGACVAAAVVGRELVHYLAALVLLGLGWNLLFVAGTTLLTRTYTPAERFKAQGLNDFIVFAAQAVMSLLAGTAIAAAGWVGLNLVALPMLVAMGAAVAWLAARERTATPHAPSP
jgi:MFS family permease